MIWTIYFFDVKNQAWLILATDNKYFGNIAYLEYIICFYQVQANNYKLIMSTGRIMTIR